MKKGLIITVILIVIFLIIRRLNAAKGQDAAKEIGKLGNRDDEKKNSELKPSMKGLTKQGLPVVNIIQVRDSLMKNGITNNHLITGILATIAKESLFVPKRENMNYTTAERLTKIFPSYFKTKEDAQPYVKQPEKLANKVYGGKYGNNSNGDGWKYRGSAYNGITFKDNYKRYGKAIGVDLVNNPDRANDLTVAADLISAYYLDTLPNLLAKYGAKNINDFNDENNALTIAINATAGAKAKQWVIDWAKENALKFIDEVRPYSIV